MNYKTQTLFILLLLPFYTIYAQFDLSREIKSNVRLTSVELPNAITNYYEGLIDNKHPISISITHLDNQITAVYTDYYQKEAINLYGQYDYNTTYNYNTKAFNPPYFTFFASGLRNATKAHTFFFMMQIEPYDAETLVITEHYLNKAVNTKLYLTKQPTNHTYIKKFNTAEFIEQAQVKTALEGEYNLQDLHKTQWLYPTIAHTNAAIEKEINRKIEALVVNSVADFTTVEDELVYHLQNNRQTILDQPITYSTPNLQAWDILINSLPPDSLHYAIHNVKVAYNANNIIQLNSHSVYWSGDTVPIAYETKLINTNTGNYITFDECFLPQAKEVIYNYLLQHHWEPTTIDRNITDKMFGINNYGISYQFYEAPLLHVSLKQQNITVPFKLLNKYIKANGPLGVFKRKK